MSHETNVISHKYYLQFINERLELLNSGQGFNDAFEEQIGVLAESKTDCLNEYIYFIVAQSFYLFASSVYLYCTSLDRVPKYRFGSSWREK